MTASSAANSWQQRVAELEKENQYLKNHFAQYTDYVREALTDLKFRVEYEWGYYGSEEDLGDTTGYKMYKSIENEMFATMDDVLGEDDDAWYEENGTLDYSIKRSWK